VKKPSTKSTARVKYTDTFKRRAVGRLQNESATALARELKCSTASLYAWRAKYGSATRTKSRDSANPPPASPPTPANGHASTNGHASQKHLDDALVCLAALEERSANQPNADQGQSLLIRFASLSLSVYKSSLTKPEKY
jgi:transposase-like protein